MIMIVLNDYYLNYYFITIIIVVDNAVKTVRIIRIVLRLYSD